MFFTRNILKEIGVKNLTTIAFEFKNELAEKNLKSRPCMF